MRFGTPQRSGSSFIKFTGTKYFTAGTQLKFLPAQNKNVVFGGDGNSSRGDLTVNGPSIIIPSDGFYLLTVLESFSTGPPTYFVESVDARISSSTNSDEILQFDVTNDEFFINSTAAGSVRLKFRNTTIDGTIEYGDNLGNGTLEIDGALIQVPNTGVSRRFEFKLNFNGSGTYTIN